MKMDPQCISATRVGRSLSRVGPAVLLLAVLVGCGDAGDPAAQQLAPGIAAMNHVQQALQRFEGTHQRFPTTAEGLAILTTAGPPGIESPMPVAQLTDPWGGMWHYACPSTHRGEVFDLWSAGPDYQSGTADDVVSWMNPAR